MRNRKGIIISFMIYIRARLREHFNYERKTIKRTTLKLRTISTPAILFNSKMKLLQKSNMKFLTIILLITVAQVQCFTMARKHAMKQLIVDPTEGSIKGAVRPMGRHRHIRDILKAKNEAANS